MNLLFLLLNVAALKVGWVLGVLGAASGIGWAGPLWAVLIVLLYLAFASNRARELTLVLLVCVLGTALDTAMMRLGLIEFATPGPIAAVAPLWIVGLWLLLATAMTRSLSWMMSRVSLAVAFGFLAAPLSYWAGVSLGAAEFSAGLLPGLAAYALAWGTLLPLLVILVRVAGGDSTDGTGKSCKARRLALASVTWRIR